MTTRPPSCASGTRPVTRLHVYSSGSVVAQRLFFGHSIAGDLTPLFSGWFDTETGAASYRRRCGNLPGGRGWTPAT